MLCGLCCLVSRFTAEVLIVKQLLIALMLVAIAVPAVAFENPDLAIFLDADMDTGNAVVNEVCPDIGGTFSVYVCFDRFGDGGGMLGAAFMFDRTFSGFKLSQTNLLPGLAFGDVEVDGWAITAGSECQYPDANGVLVAATCMYLYQGAPGTITIVPHPIDTNSAADCLNQLDFWCVASLMSHGFRGNLGVCTTAPDGDCVSAGWPSSVLCEPQGGENPVHPVTYWYSVTPGMGVWPYYGFSVQVFDPDIENYTNWVEPDGWMHSDSVQQIEDELWVAWCHESGAGLDWTFRFQFDNPNPPDWGHWTITGSGDCDPFGYVMDASWNYTHRPDGYGHRVHVPVASSPVDGSSWGRIKAIYR